jgi:muramoyltetrapeptide carboxypeptidase
MVAAGQHSNRLCSEPIMARSRARLPPPLQPGDVVAVVAPSSPFPRADLWRGLGWLRQRYRVRMRADALARDAYLAGDDARRAAELSAALRDDEVRAIAVARGGYGATRIVDALPWDDLGRRPKWVIGFSDVTALHAMAWRAGVASVHGPNVTGLGRDASPQGRGAWLASVERPAAARAWRGLQVVREGSAAGPIVGGNLAILQAMAAAQQLVIPDGAVVALEDVTEAPYRVDRMLTSLRLGGHLARAAGIVIGGFDHCPAGPDGRTVDEVVAERTRDLGVPVLAGAPFGHGSRNEAFVLGSLVEIEGDTVRFAAEE